MFVKNNMALKHYYIEDVSVNPMRENRIKSVPSIQFNQGWTLDGADHKTTIVCIEGIDGKNFASVRIPLVELRLAYEWLSGKQPSAQKDIVKALKPLIDKQKTTPQKVA